MLFIGIALFPISVHAQQQNNAGDRIRADLEMLAAGKGKIEPLAVTYHEVRGPHSALTLTIHGNGVVEMKTVNRGIGQPRMVTGPELKKLVDLLLREKIWEQRVPQPMPVSDQGVVKLTVSYDKDNSTIWEFYNDLKTQKRIFNILALMGQITSTTP